MIEKNQLRSLISRTLYDLRMHSDAAVELLMGTAAVESKLGSYIRQEEGPALGIMQMEPRTEHDRWFNYLAYRQHLKSRVELITGRPGPGEWLEYDLKYQIVMARIFYFSITEKLPEANDIIGLANYWKTYYNTEKGKGTVDKFVSNYKKYC